MHDGGGEGADAGHDDRQPARSSAADRRRARSGLRRTPIHRHRAEKKLDILIPFDESCFVAWEPRLGDGSTSARFAVVDYDAHTEVLAPPAQWGRRSALLVEPGKRVQNVRNYEDELGDGAGDLPGYQELEKAWLDAPQPWRTDCEHARSGAEFADVEIEPH